MFHWLILAIAAICGPRARLVAENLCLRQQLVVLKRGQKRPALRNRDRRFWIVASRCFAGWRETLLIVQPETVLRWHRSGWKAYWRWRSQQRRGGGRRRIPVELRELIRRMARENPLWGQQRIQGELAALGFTVCARTVAKYMRKRWSGQPSPGWRQFLTQHAKEIWACDLFTVHTVWFRTLYVFFVIHHASREIVHARVTANPTAEWLAQQMTEACNPDRTVRAECLDHSLVLGHQHLPRLIDEYVAYYNDWRPHRSQAQRAPCRRSRRSPDPGDRIVADPVLGGLHHVYRFAA